jgi:hypothetical protein
MSSPDDTAEAGVLAPRHIFEEHFSEPELSWDMD